MLYEENEINRAHENFMYLNHYMTSTVQVLYMSSIQQWTKLCKENPPKKSKDYKRAAKCLQEKELHRQFVKSGTIEENRDTNNTRINKLIS